MFLAANQLRSQGYPCFANSHGKGGVLRAERRGGRVSGGVEGEVDEGWRWKRGGRDGCLFFFLLSLFSPGGRPMLRGRVILGVRLGGSCSDKAGLGSGRRRRRKKGAAGPPRAARPSARSAQEPDAKMNYYCDHC